MAMAVCNARQRLAEVNPDGVKYFMENLMLQIYEHFDDQELIDVTLKLSNPAALVTAHRLILSAASPYFRQLFKSEKGLCPLIEITEVKSDTFERLITFCYTGKALITLENVDEMLKAAIILQLDGVVTHSVDFIIDNIADYTLERAHALESETHNDLLSQKLLEYEIRNFKEFVQSTEFLNFEATKLQTILESDDLNIQSEKEVFDAVKRWYEHDPPARKQKLPELIGRLRLTQFDTNYITTNIHPLPGCNSLALEALAWLNAPLSRSILTLKYTMPRVGQSESAEEFLALNIEKSNGQLYQYNKTEDSWKKWCNLEMDIVACGVIFLNESLIFIGGLKNGKATTEVSSWNFKTKAFKKLLSMNQSRDYHSVVLLNDKIYAIGGKDNTNKVLQSVEMYSVSNGWQTISSMITARSSAAAVSFNGKIYVMGGNNGVGLKSVELYDPTTDCWAQCADMNEVHGSPHATVHNGQIFVIGGINEKDIKTVERYDPLRNEWTKICSLSVGRWGLGSITIYNQVWAIGGRYGSWGDNTYRDCVSVYDEQNNEWIDKRPIPSGGRYYCFTVPKALLQSDQNI